MRSNSRYGNCYRRYSRRPNQAGSIYRRSDSGKWTAALIVEGRRITRTATTRHQAEIILRTMLVEHGLAKPKRVMPMRQSLRPLARTFVERLLSEARRETWDDEFLASAIVAALAVKRVRFGVFGPCVYCGTWLAQSVDHIIPASRGGSDEHDNLVSACNECNQRKQARTPDEWARSA